MFTHARRTSPSMARPPATKSSAPRQAAALPDRLLHQGLPGFDFASIPTIQRKATIGEPGDASEREADEVADWVTRMAEPPLGSAFAAGRTAPRIQRACAACAMEEDETLRGKPTGSALTAAPDLTGRIEAARGQGAPLPLLSRAFFEPRLGHDFSHVTVHTDARANALASELGARAFALGHDIYFSAGEYAPESPGGRWLLAHELAHVVQQRAGGAPAVQRSIRPEDRDQNPLALPSLSSLGSPAVSPLVNPLLSPTPAAPPTPAPPQARPRGPNPAVCITPVIAGLDKNKTALADPQGFGKQLIKQVVACLRAGAPASNARFGNEIVDNIEAEITSDVDAIDQDWNKKKSHTAAERRDYVGYLIEIMSRRQSEAEVSFRYDVVFQRDAGGPEFAIQKIDWREIDAALAAIPDQYLWNRTTGLLRLHRETGTVPNVGGETKSASEISVYDPGVGTAPYPRSKGIKNLTATAQTLRHEFGHLVQSYMLPTATRAELFTLMGWTTYPWAWTYQIFQARANPTTCPAPNLENERCRVCDDAGFTSGGKRDWAGLDQFLVSLGTTPTPRKARDWTHAQGASFLNAWTAGAVPSGPAWEYAATGQDDYFSELFAFAISDPEFVHAQVPAAQVNWLKERVFDTQKEIDAAIKDNQLAVQGDAATRFAAQAPALVARLFTAQQIRAALAALVSQLLRDSTARGRNTA